MREPRKIYTIITTRANAEQGVFQSPTPGGSFFSPNRAQAEFFYQVFLERETLDSSLYDTMELNDTLWYTYLDGHASERFIRIEIVTSLLMEKGMYYD